MITIPLSQVLSEDPSRGLSRAILGLVQRGQGDAAALVCVALSIPGLGFDGAIQDALLSLAVAVESEMFDAGYTKGDIVNASSAALMGAVQAFPEIQAAAQAQFDSTDPVVLSIADQWGIPLDMIPDEILTMRDWRTPDGSVERAGLAKVDFVMDALRGLRDGGEVEQETPLSGNDEPAESTDLENEPSPTAPSPSQVQAVGEVSL